MKCLILFLLVSIGFHVQAAWNLNDVSYLLPLPGKIGQDSLIRLETLGGKGRVLPKTSVDQLPPLVMSVGRQETDQALRVVSIRLDPCFVTTAPERCEKQIRFVWQPILKNSSGSVQTEDAALHSFYVLTDSEFSSLLSDLQVWKKKFQIKTEGLPLQVLPALLAPMANNPALMELQNVFLKYVGESNLTKLTAMVLRGGADMWVFMQFDIIDGKLVQQPIARLNGKMTQAFVNQVGQAKNFGRVFVTPEPATLDYPKTILSPSEELGPEQDPKIQSEYEILNRLEDPTKFHANNMDCVSCHIAQPAKQWAQREKSHLNLQDLWANSLFQSARHNLQNTSPGLWHTQMIRGFGYFGSRPAISQRVINESAAVADSLEAFAALRTSAYAR